MARPSTVVKITEQQAHEITATDPPPREDGKCVVCLKARKPERSKTYAGITATLDPFCSNECARHWYDNPLPTKSIWSMYDDPVPA